jgi:ribosome-binding factor A
MEMKDPRVGMVSVNEVRVSRDLGYADVYVSSLNDRDAAERDELIEVLGGAAGWLRSLIAKRSKMRPTPHLRFHWDALPERGRALDRLIDEARASDKEQDPLDDEAAHPDRENDSSGT